VHGFFLGFSRAMIRSGQAATMGGLRRRSIRPQDRVEAAERSPAFAASLDGPQGLDLTAPGRAQ
jgi:hypothetical protein